MKKSFCFTTIVMIAIFIVGCSRGEISQSQSISGKTVEEVLNKGRTVSVILHKEELENGILVFYIPDIKGEPEASSKLGIEYLEKTFRGWNLSYKGGGYTTSVDDLVHFESLPNDNDKDTPLPLIYGEINGSDIEELFLIDLNTEAKKKADIINLGRKPGMKNDMRVWYVTIDNPENSNFIIQGIGFNGEILFSKETNTEGTDTQLLQN